MTTPAVTTEIIEATETPVIVKSTSTGLFDYDCIATLADDHAEQMGYQASASTEIKDGNTLVLQVVDKNESATYVMDLHPDKLADMETKYEELSDLFPADEYENMWRALMHVIEPHCLIRTEVAC